MRPSVIIAAAGATLSATFIAINQRQQRQAAERLAAASLETLLNAIDANDSQTGTHVRRVAVYAGILADAANLPEYEQWLAAQVALFHDVGKIHEALFDIIHVDTKLTPEERRAMLTHPQRGATVLAPLSSFYPGLPVGVLAHHERWNGTGYPRQLKGARIPLAARIVAIADTFDAITSSRRYRAGRSPEAAREIICNARGTEFDPELVDLFTLPPVFARILEAHRSVSRWKTPVKPRVRGHEDDSVPTITFRWRPSQVEGRLRRAREA